LQNYLKKLLPEDEDDLNAPAFKTPIEVSKSVNAKPNAIYVS